MHRLHHFLLLSAVLCVAVLALPLPASDLAAADADSTLGLDVTVPEIDAQPYHRPYVAIWIETPERQVVRNLVLWYEEDTWLKDLRQWWRAHGRYQGHDAEQKGVDGFSGATRRPGDYALAWDGLGDDGQPAQPGSYVLHVESVREEGGRSYLRQPFEITGDGAVSTPERSLPAEAEIGPIALRIPGTSP